MLAIPKFPFLFDFIEAKKIHLAVLIILLYHL